MFTYLSLKIKDVLIYEENRGLKFQNWLHVWDDNILNNIYCEGGEGEA